jgi:hypothetical protein
VKDLLRLSDDAAFNQFAGSGILCDLTARVHAIAVAHGGREWTDWFGETVRRYGFERHVRNVGEGV